MSRVFDTPLFSALEENYPPFFQLVFSGCFALLCPSQGTLKGLHMWPLTLLPCVPERGQSHASLVPGMFT